MDWAIKHLIIPLQVFLTDFEMQFDLTDDVKLRNWNKIKTCHFWTDKLTPGNALSPLILTDIFTKSPKWPNMAKIAKKYSPLLIFTRFTPIRYIWEIQRFSH